MRIEGDDAIVDVRGEVRRTPLGLLRTAARQEDAELAATYSELVRQADELLRERWRRTVLRAVQACGGHTAQDSTEPGGHTAQDSTEPTCYVGPVGRGDFENRAAHGGITYREVCRCGAERGVNLNQCHVEYSAWYAPVSR
jgi:hypothetical protein